MWAFMRGGILTVLETGMFCSGISRHGQGDMFVLEVKVLRSLVALLAK